jgi:hypothetical protein
MMLGIALGVGMPLPWTIGEGPWVIFLGGVIFWLAGRVRFPAMPVQQASVGK